MDSADHDLVGSSHHPDWLRPDDGTVLHRPFFSGTCGGQLLSWNCRVLNPLVLLTRSWPDNGLPLYRGSHCFVDRLSDCGFAIGSSLVVFGGMAMAFYRGGYSRNYSRSRHFLLFNGSAVAGALAAC